MSKTICIINQKGGVGKTTTSVNVAGILADRGYRVLLIDSDPQSNATAYYNMYESELPGIYDVMLRGVPVAKAARETSVENLYILPATFEFRKADGALSLINMGKEFVLSEALKPERDKYEYIIIDCPPDDDNVTTNDLVASDYVLLPTIPDDFAFESIRCMSELLIKVCRTSNPGLNNLGMLITIDENTVSKKAYKDALREAEFFPCMNTVIRKNTKLQEAINAHLPINIYDASCAGSLDYGKLVDELIEKTCGTGSVS
jgi:chromosome partitioning protein